MVAAGTIVVLVLLLAALARWARRRRLLLATVGLLLLAALAAQLWLGVLLMYDTPSGRIDQFRPPPTAAAASVPQVR